ncbi:MAG: carboxypeptidase M32 [Desulfobulbaceae bacterium]|nr:carboxypeptidase M32 [Desulfobulbaceae bacterium]HIJ78135.1 carboxypeptidase M32 [Deltaproteobacteria bacterium]
MDTMAALKARSAQLVDLHHIMALMQWDQEVGMPRRAAAGRAGQFATLSGLLHRQETDPKLGELLARAGEQPELSGVEQALVRVLRRSYNRNTKLPEAFVTEFAQLTSEAQACWVEARQRSDFALFRPLLEKLVVMSRRQADYFGYADHPYDALLDIYEEGLTTAATEQMFARLKEPLIARVHKWQGRTPGLRFAEPFAGADQERFAARLLAAMGFDFDRGSLARSIHPFSTTLGHHDRRVTNRYSPHGLDFVFGALHEGGHALYEQGISDELAHSHLDDGVSLGIHESQSRLWENIIGRSRPFWERFFPELQTFFPAQFAGVDFESFIQGINRVEPGLIRVDSDEVCYNLHVLIRFELEKALLEGALAVADLPVAWNEKYDEYLGVKVGSDEVGVLQDIHWSHGSFGYFPTYTIGNLAAAQIWAQYKKVDSDYEQTIGTGDFFKIRQWLTEQLYRHGSVYPPTELLEKVTGQPLDSKYFLEYLDDKISGIAG